MTKGLKTFYHKLFYNFFHKFFFLYIKMSEDSSARYYRKNKEKLKKSPIKVSKSY